MSDTATLESIENEDLTIELFAQVNIDGAKLKRSDRRKFRELMEGIEHLATIRDEDLVTVARFELEPRFNHLAVLVTARTGESWTGESLYEACEKMLDEIRGHAG